ncbi:hypothetical protein [Rubinisphaera margarita]|uniref:hypothetical protein n=1 Tax=Rubinisphaera margarita TaxID=2909586 RepID=UPI001EE913AB|nr:hypothetical protein [Rubinisphaera margarita]MCG6154662.1 hypothetical protein [Rubinisphaera margarita]
METAGVVVWSSRAEERRDGLEEAVEIARGTSQPHPITLNNYRCLVHPYGMGKGRQTHLKFRITWGDVTLGLDFRSKASRRFHNFSLTVPGGPCLIHGGLAVREWAFKIVNALGGGIHDEWIRRLDVCVDLPGLNPRQDLFPACCGNQFTSTAKHHRVDCHQGETETFTLSSTDRLTLQIYDKLREATSKNDPVYLQSMIDNRWNGTLPKAATRVELRVYRNWLAQWEDDHVERILSNLGSVVERLLPETGKAFFRLLDRAPDRKNKHQSRCEVHPLWKIIREVLVQQETEQDLEFKRVRYGAVSQRRLFSMIKSLLLRCAVEQNRTIRDIRGAKELLHDLSYANDMNDWAWYEAWKEKASKHGLYDAAIEFDFGLNVQSF